MASSKVISTGSRKSDLTRRASSSSSSSSSSASSSSMTTGTKTERNQNQTKNSHNSSKFTSHSSSTMTVDGILRNVYNSNSALLSTTESTLLDAQITLIEAPTIPASNNGDAGGNNANALNLTATKTVDDVWREIVAGEKKSEDVMMKEEAPEEDDSSEMMTLEDFLVKAGAVEVCDDHDVKVQQQQQPPSVTERLSGGIYTFDPVVVGPPAPFSTVEGSIIGFGNGVEVIGGGGGGSGSGSGGGGSGRGKRGRMLMEPLDKAAQQRQRRMIKNRESAARSRERKQVVKE